MNTSIRGIIRESLYGVTEMSKFTPSGVRGKWTKEKIKRYLKSHPSDNSSKFWVIMNEYKSFEEFSDNIYWHGGNVPGKLLPSIVIPRFTDRSGGGGYGLKYWVVSVSKSRRSASSFSGDRDHVNIYPVLIKPGSKIIDQSEIPNGGGRIKDSDQLEEHIEWLWDNGVDAVWLGGDEYELCLVNPKCSVVGDSETFRVFNINVKDLDESDLYKMWEVREMELQRRREKHNKSLEYKNEEKRKKIESYQNLLSQLEKEIEDYIPGESNIYKLSKLYNSYANVGISLIKHVEVHKTRKKIEDRLKVDSGDLYTFKREGVFI
jgi:hypothetical protein